MHIESLSSILLVHTWGRKLLTVINKSPNLSFSSSEAKGLHNPKETQPQRFLQHMVVIAAEEPERKKSSRKQKG